MKNFIQIKKLFFVLLVFNSILNAQTTTINGPVGSELFALRVSNLPNGNFVIIDPFFDNGATANVGAVYLYNGITQQLISTLKGEKANDAIGFEGIEILTNGNFLVKSSGWQNGSLQGCGAITWVNATLGLNGVVNQTNSLVGVKANDGIGSGGVFNLPNGNYVVCSKRCDNGSVIDVGAVTWGNGTTGTSGFVTTSNSLLGSSVGDYIGDKLGMDVKTNRIKILSNSNFVIQSSEWDNAGIVDVGAITWVNGSVGIAGIVSASNSLIGTVAEDKLGEYGITTLTNGNYVIISSVWDNASIVNAGAVTWCNGATGLTGFISNTNSLVGDRFSMLAGFEGVYALTNGNYVVCTSSWYDALGLKKGAVTFCNGSTGKTGLITPSNSLVGNDQDRLGITGIAVLPNGNYVVKSPSWFSERGAVTWCNGTTGQTINNAPISAANSLIGLTIEDSVGEVVVFPNSNYLVKSYLFDNGSIVGVGALTLCNGTMGNTVGAINITNSILGSSTADSIGGGEITILSNGNFVTTNPFWNDGAKIDVGAISYRSSVFTTGQPSPTSGFLNSSNSLIGSTAFDQLGLNVGGLSSAQRRSVTALSNGNYVVVSPRWANGALPNVGAVTLGIGTTGITGFINSGNSLIGSSASDFVGNDGVIPLDNGNYVVNSRGWDEGAISNAGAITFCSGSTPTVGAVNSNNSLIASVQYDSAKNDLESVPNNYYMIKGQGSQFNNFKYGVTIVSAATGLSGYFNSCSSVVAINNYPTNSYNAVNNFLLVGISDQNKAVIFKPQSQALSPSNTTFTTAIQGSGMVTFVDSNCFLVASLQSNGANPISGSTTAKVWLETTQPSNFVKRHFEITPTTNPTTATGKVTLYFTQQEFNDFNDFNAVKLPINASDNAGIANILVEKRGGTSNNGSGLPNSYTNSISTINPTDSEIVWDAQNSRWQITFDVTGFSGFFLKTQSVNLKIDDFSDNENSISLYPNPVNDILNIQSTSEITQTIVYNMIGQEVINILGNKTQIDMSNLVSGIYMVKITYDKTNQVVKICKQ